MNNNYGFSSITNTAAYFLGLMCIIFTVLTPARSAATEADSLKNIISVHADDTVKADILAQLTNYYQDVQLDSMVLFANKGLALSTRLNYYFGKTEFMLKLGLAYLRKSDYATSMQFYQGAASVSEQHGMPHQHANALLAIADIYLTQGEHEKGIEQYKKAISIFDKIKYETGSGFAYLSIGGIYRGDGNYPEAVSNFYKALNCFEKDAYLPGQAMTLSDIALVYIATDDSIRANQYLLRCMAINDSAITKEQKVYIVTNSGSVLISLGKFEKALEYFNYGLLLADSIGDDSWKNSCNVKIADIHMQLRQYSDAINSYKMAMEGAMKINDPSTITAAYKGIGDVYVMQGKVREGIEYLIKAMALAKENRMNEAIFQTAKQLSSAYKQVKDDKLALKYYKIYYDYKDTLYNETSEKKVRQLQYDYELGRKQNQIELLKKDKQVQQSLHEKQTTKIWALSAGLLSFAVFCVLLYRSQRFEQKARKEIYRQKEELQVQAKRLEDLNHFKDKTFSVLSHDLRGPLDSFNSIMNLLDQQLISPEEFLKFQPDAIRKLNTLNILLDNLLNWAKNYMQGEIIARPDSVNLAGIAEQNTVMLKEAAAKKGIIISVCIPKEIEVFADQSQLQIVVRNLLMNAIKFTNLNGKIDISASVTDNTVNLLISDNGVGMDAQQLSKLFVLAGTGNTAGTAGEKGTGLGLWLCNEFVKANNGTIRVVSSPGKGSEFVISLPAA